ncbi:MAG: DNA modification methylase [Natronomonas sp.]|jgi:DNA modification methylase
MRIGDARSLDVEAGRVDLVVTSPPYPMVEMWDDGFAAQDDAIETALEAGDGDAAFEAMHSLLDDVWERVADALCGGGIVAVNVGDATRRIDDEFRLYPNHARIIEALSAAGLTQLPGIIWRKPTNSTAKFMGSGTLPTNAYATLEHEHILLFRKGGTRSFPPNDDDRYASAFFYEERNEWFSDCWEVRGRRQTLDDDDGARERSGAFPLEIPLRLVRMYSVQGDTVLDPFAGTGTTSLAALLEGRSSVGVERDPTLASAFETRSENAPTLSRDIAAERLADHRSFIADNEDNANYEADHYDTRVVTNNERGIRLPTVTDIQRLADDPLRFTASHEPF